MLEIIFQILIMVFAPTVIILPFIMFFLIDKKLSKHQKIFVIIFDIIITLIWDFIWLTQINGVPVHFNI